MDKTADLEDMTEDSVVEKKADAGESGVLVVVGARDAVVGRCTRGVEDSSRQEEPLKKEVDGEWL